MKALIFFLCCFSTCIYGQDRTNDLYRKSIDLAFEECKCDTLIFLADDCLDNFTPVSSMGYIKKADSIFFSKITAVDTFLALKKIFPLKLTGSYIEIVINAYTLLVKDKNLTFLLNESLHFYFQFDWKTKRYRLIKKNKIGT